MRIKFIEDFLKYLRTKEVLKHIQPKESHLDVGCGDGTLLRLSPCKIKIGIDKRTTGQRAEDELPKYPDNFFDYVTIVAALEHFDDPELVIRESCRILKPDGTIIITMNKKWIDPFICLFSDLQKEHNRYLSYEEISKTISPSHKIVKYYTFELGLNQVFIIRRI